MTRENYFDSLDKTEWSEGIQFLPVLTEPYVNRVFCRKGGFKILNMVPMITEFFREIKQKSEFFRYFFYSRHGFWLKLPMLFTLILFLPKFNILIYWKVHDIRKKSIFESS